MSLSGSPQKGIVGFDLFLQHWPLALCLQIMTRPSCTTVTEVATTTTTTKVDMGLISMMTVFLVLSIVLCQEVTKRHCET